jgi:hypothetical protein
VQQRQPPLRVVRLLRNQATRWHCGGGASARDPDRAARLGSGSGSALLLLLLLPPLLLLRRGQVDVDKRAVACAPAALVPAALAAAAAARRRRLVARGPGPPLLVLSGGQRGIGGRPRVARIGGQPEGEAADGPGKQAH